MTGLESTVYAVGLVLAPLCAAGLVLSEARWLTLGMFQGVFAGAALVLGGSGQPRIAAALFLTGALCCVILAFGFRRAAWTPGMDRGGSIPGGRAFRLATVLLVGTAAWGLSTPVAAAVILVPSARLTAATFVFAMGLLQLGLSQEQGAVTLGLLTTVVGFEMFYVLLEPSLALRAVLAAIMLGIAMVTSVLLEASLVPEVDDRRGP